MINEKYLNNAGNILEGLVFFCSREVPRYTLEYVILAFGGEILWETDTVNITNKRITHVLTDRDPKFIKFEKNKEYI